MNRIYFQYFGILFFMNRTGLLYFHKMDHNTHVCQIWLATTEFSQNKNHHGKGERFLVVGEFKDNTTMRVDMIPDRDFTEYFEGVLR